MIADLPKKEIIGKTSSVKMPEEMKRVVMEFLRTNKSQRLGFDSISDVVTAAVRDLLEKYNFYEESEKKEQKY